jgi:hypothetical protein
MEIAAAGAHNMLMIARRAGQTCSRAVFDNPHDMSGGNAGSDKIYPEGMLKEGVALVTTAVPRAAPYRFDDLPDRRGRSRAACSLRTAA